MAEHKSIFDAFGAFTEKLKRFNEADVKYRKEDNSPDAAATKIIKEKLDLRKNNVIASFKMYEVAMTKEIEEDEESILKAYEIFKAALEASKNTGDEKTFIKEIKFESTVLKRSNYIYCGQFVYLQCWFKQVKKNEDFVPVLEQFSETKYFLKFIPAEDFEFSAEEKELVQIITEYLSEKK